MDDLLLKLKGIEQKIRTYLQEAIQILNPSKQRWGKYILFGLCAWLILSTGLLYGIMNMERNIAHIKASYSKMEILHKSLVAEKESKVYHLWQKLIQQKEQRKYLKRQVVDVLSDEPVVVRSIEEKDYKGRTYIHFTYESTFYESMNTWSDFLERLPYCECIITEMHSKGGTILTKGYVAV